MQKKVIIVAISAFLSCPLLATAKISNMIVFGDSLSDVGNFPESPKAFWNSKAPKSVLNSVADFYVPFSNPVNTHGINPFNTPWPPLDDQYLATQASIDKHPGTRQYRSISWPQYFLSIAKEKKLIESAIISPSYLIHVRAMAKTISFSYAWGYATSTNGCVNPKYKPFDQCNNQTILTARKNYFDHPSAKNYATIQIPGFIQQVQLFIQDYQKHKVAVDRNTLYTVWIGANDLISASNHLFHHYNTLPMFSYVLGSVSSHVLKGVEMLIHTLPQASRPKVVYVFNAFNPQLTPAFYYGSKGKLGKYLIKASNFWLTWDIKLFNVFSATKIIIVPSYDWFQTESRDQYFKNKMSEACQIVVGHYQRPDYAPPSNCDGFMFWNAVHPATPMYNMIARLLYKETGGIEKRADQPTLEED